MSLRRTGIKRSRKRINPVSEKKRGRDKVYGTIRLAVLARDRHCQYPGCRVATTRCDVHHILTGGGDVMDNLISLCNDFASGHHTWTHANRREAETLGLRRSGVRVPQERTDE